MTSSELGVNQEFNLYWDNDLAENFSNSDVEVCIGFDLSKNDSFTMPVKEQLPFSMILLCTVDTGRCLRMGGNGLRLPRSTPRNRGHFLTTQR